MLAKCEFFNPLASVKDRIGVAMIEAGERDGKIDKDTVIVEPTSGNTGIALAFVCAAKGYKLILTMPESMSIERRRLLKALGAQVVLTPAADGMRGAINKAEEILERAQEELHAAAVRQPRQPGDPPQARRPRRSGRTPTAQVDILVAGVGTGGTITGVAEVIKPRKPSFKAIAVEPVASPVITQTLKRRAGEARPAQDPGDRRRASCRSNLHTNIVDEVVQITDDEAFEWARRLREGGRHLRRHQLRRQHGRRRQGRGPAGEQGQDDRHRSCAASASAT